MSGTLNFLPAEESLLSAKIKVVGIGGAGGNAVDRMILSGLNGVDFVTVNTDAQALDKSRAPNKIQIGRQLTKGLGAGANPDVGRQAAEQDSEQLEEQLAGSDLIFITAGMGGGTGTGAAPKAAEIARAIGALTVAIVTKPFTFEGRRRMSVAEAGIHELRDMVDTLIVIQNEQLLKIADAKTTLLKAFEMADSILTQATRGISDLIAIPGIVNLDFADVRAIMEGMGDALMGIGSATGDERGIEAAKMAIASPLLEDVSITGAQGVLVNITGSSEMTLFEVNEAASVVHEAAGERANVIFGAVIDDSIGDSINVTVIATGFQNANGYSTKLEPDKTYDFRPRKKFDMETPTYNRQKEESFALVESGDGNGNGNGDSKKKQNRIHLGEVDINSGPPADLNVPAFMRRNG
ncbi:MAG: cell division protein FtsZ [Calditrichaeota bacterium]|nr:cell division protein FtsZ [Calditrichota bacterium]